MKEKTTSTLTQIPIQSQYICFDVLKIYLSIKSTQDCRKKKTNWHDIMVAQEKSK